MMDIGNALQAFESAAGVTPTAVSLILRSLILTTFLLWSAWTVHGHYQLIQAKSMDIYDLPMKLLRVLFLCALMSMVVYVS